MRDLSFMPGGKWPTASTQGLSGEDAQASCASCAGMRIPPLRTYVYTCRGEREGSWAARPCCMHGHLGLAHIRLNSARFDSAYGWDELWVSKPRGCQPPILPRAPLKADGMMGWACLPEKPFWGCHGRLPSAASAKACCRAWLPRRLAEG